MQLSSKKILYASLKAFFVAFLAVFLFDGTPLGDHLFTFMLLLLVLCIFPSIIWIILMFIYRKIFSHSNAPPKQEKIKENQKISQSSKNALLEENEKKVEDLFDDI